jgi:Holliday junction resolvase-like predicted endonuclease
MMVYMKNTNMGAQDRGAYAELRVCEYFTELGYQVRSHRKKIFGVEYDWIFESASGAAFVEVKSVRSADFYVQRWPWRQKQRFLRVAAILAEKERAQFFLALVDYKDKVHLFKVGSDI